MTTSPIENDDEQTPDQAIREAAWTKALRLSDEYEDAQRAASGGPGGRGYRDPLARRHADVLYTQLRELIREFDFWDTYVDEWGLTVLERNAASRKCPPADRPRCTGDARTCSIHGDRALFNGNCWPRSERDL